MTKRKHHSQEVAAAKTGISVRSARRIERDAMLPSHKPRRYWRSRPDPFAAVWDAEVVPLLASTPRLQAITILRKLQDDHPGLYPDSMRRTLERHVRRWKALEGPPKEVFFAQEHVPGVRGLSDFTDMADLRITLAGAPFAHRLYHFVLAFSRWEYADVATAARVSKPCPAGCRTRCGKPVAARGNIAPTACRPRSRIGTTKRTSPCAMVRCSNTTA
jgi:hypothetical protein